MQPKQQNIGNQVNPIHDDDDDDGNKKDDENNNNMTLKWHDALKILHHIRGDANFLHSPQKEKTLPGTFRACLATTKETRLTQAF